MSVYSKNNIKNLKIAVIGAGIMGQHHLRILTSLKNIEVVGVVDIHEERAEKAGLKFRCPYFKRYEEIISQVDAVIIAVPTQHHTKIGEFFLKNNVHCLIEKPLALTEKECLSLIDLAKQKNLVLAVGHTEHYNAAVEELRKILINSDQRILTIDAFRLNFGSSRITDIDIILDLMVHDLDVVTSLIPEEYIAIEARDILSSEDSLNHVFANIVFKKGTIVNLTASRITPNTFRKLQVTTNKAQYFLDYQSQELIKTTTLSNMVSLENKPNSIISERIPVRVSDALTKEVSAFVDAVLNNGKDYVDGKKALTALRLAWEIQEKVKRYQMLSRMLVDKVSDHASLQV